MNLTYFKSQICDELRGARDYAQLALATRADYPEWSKNFAEMSEGELGHAYQLFNMAEKYHAALSDEEKQGQAGRLYRDIVHLMTEDYTKIKWMHEMLKPAQTPQPVTTKPISPLQVQPTPVMG